MSNFNYTHDILKSLDLFDENNKPLFLPSPYPDTDSCIRDEKNKNGKMIRYFRLVAVKKDLHPCPHCGTADHHESKGLRTIFLKHNNNGHRHTELEVVFRRYHCKHCNHYFHDEIPFKAKGMRITTVAAQACLAQMRESHSLASIARTNGITKSSVYRLFHDHIHIPFRYYRLPEVMSIDEFRATTDLGTFAFHITDPVNGKTIDIIQDRQADYLRKYFSHISFQNRKKVKIIIMDMSGPFRALMKALFPNAVIICDRFHYIKLFREHMNRSRIDTCNTLSNDKLARSIKRELHLFDKYSGDLDERKVWFDRHLKRHFTCRTYIEYIFEQPETEEFYENYKIYQSLLKLIHEPQSDYKKELNKILDHIFDTKNEYYTGSAKNIRKNWFMPILNSLTMQARYRRKGKEYFTSFNNGFVECMNNQVKLVKRNAFGYRYFYNFRKRALLYLKFSYEFV